MRGCGEVHCITNTKNDSAVATRENRFYFRKNQFSLNRIDVIAQHQNSDLPTPANFAEPTRQLTSHVRLAMRNMNSRPLSIIRRLCYILSNALLQKRASRYRANQSSFISYIPRKLLSLKVKYFPAFYNFLLNQLIT